MPDLLVKVFYQNFVNIMNSENISHYAKKEEAKEDIVEYINEFLLASYRLDQSKEAMINELNNPMIDARDIGTVT